MTKTEQGNRQKRLRCHPRVDTGLPNERVIGADITKCERLFQMRTGRGKPADKHPVAPERLVRQDEPRSVVALSAQTQQIFVQTMRQIQFAADLVIERLRIGNPKELRRKAELFPQFSCATEISTSVVTPDISASHTATRNEAPTPSRSGRKIGMIS